jgi:hypothetical protein
MQEQLPRGAKAPRRSKPKPQRIIIKCSYVARIERSEIRESLYTDSPDFAALYPGYDTELEQI